ncbi:hypothetical protein KJY77_02430 [Canibacter sp. lx-72]|uniref:zinc ribbon domain-containing protein n=1 Tax=Canibacter zhuwentaonis TaxID=2837491 RepID=UPI001BDC5FE2|nr:hypothetical protein [Canibacter zhuwentaonis]MBT1017999.1 hypothetical protein [Canibacter zhuwentaonis]MBT1035159.1 hypothetical protein [Canibacter zhuwentaonis]
MRANRAQQLLLLELAAIDTKILQLEKQAKTPAEKAVYEAKSAALKPLRQNLLVLQREFDLLGGEIKRAQNEIDAVVKRIVRNKTQLASAQDAKLTQNLTAEQEQLSARKTKLEDAQLELLEKAEGLEAQISAAAADLKTAGAELVSAETKLSQAQQRIATELSELKSERAGQSAEITGELLAEYEQIRAHSGIGAAAFKNGVSAASNMKLSPGAVAELASAAEDEICYCPDTGAILVRV